MKNRIAIATSIALSIFAVSSFAQTVPADLMENCKQWKITYPDGVEDKTLCGEANNEYYYLNSAKDAIVFRVPIRSSNGSTPNSSYIRSELRERVEDGTADVYWTTAGKHVIYVKQAITHLPTVKSHLVATQIHGNKAAGIDDAMVLRLEDQHLFLSFNGGKLRSDVTIKTNYVLGAKHEVIFEVIDGKHYVYYSEDGTLEAKYKAGTASAYLVKDGTKDYVMDLNYDASYFKVGNYTQSNPDTEGSETDKPDNYGEVVVNDFWVLHGTATPVAATGISLSPATSSLKLGATVQLTPTFTPSNATVETVSYTSTATAVATVSATGLVTAKAKGTTKIIATSSKGLKDTSTITVLDIPTGLANVALNKTVKSSIAPDAATPLTNLVDGNTTTRMASSGYPQTLIIDLGASYKLSASELVFYEDRAYQYTLAISNTENGTYTQLVDGSANTVPGTVASPLTDLFSATGRYLKLTITGSSIYTGPWVSVLEFRAFGELSSTTSIGPRTIRANTSSFEQIGTYEVRGRPGVFDLLGRTGVVR